MNDLDVQINNLRTLQGSFDTLTDYYEEMANDVSVITEQISNIKGTDPNVTLTTLHNDLQRPSSETVMVTLTAAGASWTGKQVLVHDQSSDTYTGYDVTYDGHCSFTVGNGHSYEVSLPSLVGFINPTAYSFVSVNYSRSIDYTYTTDTRKETLRVIVANGMSKEQITILSGQTLTVYDTDSVAYTGTVSGSSCDIQIPYSKTYTLTPPVISGYRNDSSAVSFTASQVQRTTTILYTEDQYGLFGVDVDGKLYTIEECQALEDKTIIKYGFYNDSVLAGSTRVNDGYGNGFYWKLGAESLGSGLMWSAQAINFDTLELPYYSNLAGWKYAGRYMTDKIIEIGAKIMPSVANPTPAATACANRTETFGGKVHRGILLAYDQIVRIATTNRPLFQGLYSALGRTAPAIWSGNWWSSCQYSAQNAVCLYNGGFDTSTKTRTNGYTFLAFDL